MGQKKTSKGSKASQQQQQQQGVPAPPPTLQGLHSPAGDTAAAAAAAAAGGGEGVQAAAPQVSVSTLHELEEKKRRLSHQLKDVERQIYDLETRYLEGCNPNANALTGYEGLRTALGSAKPSKAGTVVEEDRIFSGSSTTTVAR